jgi:hypothetical protein
MALALQYSLTPAQGRIDAPARLGSRQLQGFGFGSRSAVFCSGK